MKITSKAGWGSPSAEINGKIVTITIPGLFPGSKKVTSIPTSRIQNISVAQRMTQRLSGDGDITIETAGLGTFTMRRMRDPFQFRDAVLAAM